MKIGRAQPQAVRWFGDVAAKFPEVMKAPIAAFAKQSVGVAGRDGPHIDASRSVAAEALSEYGVVAERRRCRQRAQRPHPRQGRIRPQH